MADRLALRLNGVLIRERSEGTYYEVHPDCLERLRALDIADFVEVGPVPIEGEACNFGACEHA